MGLLAGKEITPPDDDATDINDGGAKVTAGSFWPDIILADLRRSMRINGSVTTDRLQFATRTAVMNVTRQLAGWKSQQEASGYTALTGVPSDEIDDETVITASYRRAIYSHAKALLIEGYRDFDTTKQGEEHAAALTSQIDTLWRDSNWAIRDILGESRGLAELV